MPDTERHIVNHRTHHGREFIEYSDGSQWTRKVNRETNEPVGDWKQVEVQTEEPEPPALHLSVVMEHQAEDEPKHWSLFSHRPDAAGTGAGQVWQVTGDAEQMYYQHASGVDLMSSSSESFYRHQVVNNNLSESQYAKVDAVARTEPAPCAENRAAVTENCQGWTIRVLRRLAREGLVEESVISMLEGYMDAIN